MGINDPACGWVVIDHMELSREHVRQYPDGPDVVAMLISLCGHPLMGVVTGGCSLTSILLIGVASNGNLH